MLVKRKQKKGAIDAQKLQTVHALARCTMDNLYIAVPSDHTSNSHRREREKDKKRTPRECDFLT